MGWEENMDGIRIVVIRSNLLSMFKLYFSREYVPKLENLFVKQSPNENEKSVDSLSDLLPGIFLLI